MSKYGEILFNGIESNKEEGIKYIIKSASAGDINSLYNYGLLLFNGDGVEMNKEEAIKYIKVAADKGNANAMYFYGTLLEEGKYVEQNPEESIKYYRNSANKQNVEAIRRYSCILDDEEKKRNYDEFKYNKNKEIKIKRRRRSFSFIDVDKSSIFSKLDDETCKIEFINAEYNEIDSTFYVAKSLIEGINKFPQNIEIGKKYLERSIKAKDSEAIQYYSKLISFSDKEKAVYLLNEIATNYQNSYSKLSLVKQILSKESFDVNIPTSSQSVNYTLAKQLSKEASKIGNSKAMILYSKLSMKNKKNQISEIQFNFRESFQYIKRASKIGDREAMSFYGLHLERGIGCSKKKPNKAIQYYKKSYEKGDLNGYAFYGSFLIEHNKEEEGLRLIKYSCDHNNAKGIHLYGFYSFNGLSILEKNEKLAFDYFKLSQSMGNDISFNNVGIFYEKGICTNVDKKEAIKYYEKGFEEGFLNCGCQLGCLLINSDDEKELNFNEGMKYLKIASENGNVDSMYYYCLNIAQKKSTINEIAEMKYYLNKGIYLKDTDLIVLYANILLQNNNYPLEQDCVKAAKLYKLSADLGDCGGMVKFAKMLLVGNGIEANQSESLKYFKMAADKGDIQAMIDYASNLSKCEEGTFDKEEVIKYFKLAVEQGKSEPNVDLSEDKRYLDLNENKSPK